MTILALDLGKFKTVACLYTPGTDEHQFVTVPTNPQAFHDLFVAHQPHLIIIEACSIMGWVVDLAQGLDLTIQVANANDERWSWKRVKRKTDRDDALKLARLSAMNQLHLVHVPSRPIRQWRSLIVQRHRLKHDRVAIKNAIRSLLDTQAIAWPAGAKGWSVQARERLSTMACDLADCPIEQLWRGQLHIHLQQLRSVESLLHQVEMRLNIIAMADDRVRRVMTIPHVHLRTAEVLVAYLDDPDRFRSARQVSCYAGLTPRQHQSGAMNRQGRISKRGPALLRGLLLHVAWGMTRQCDQAKAVFDRVTGGHASKRKKAAVAVGRKVLICAWAMMRDRTDWQPQKMGLAASAV